MRRLAVALASALALAAWPAAGEATRFGYDAPLDPRSPWPKFRRDVRQTGRSPVEPVDSGAAPWIFRTGKGVFSSPVIDGDGTVYLGSADRHFYAIDRAGRLQWKFLTGEIIDSSALLDDAARVIFGSGDGRLYALDRRGGAPRWTFTADPPSANGAFINWFEGNVAIGPDGTLFVPNDNFCTYGIARATGERRWCFKTWDQTWSLPALNPQTNTLFIGNNFAFFRNVLALDAATGRTRWRASTAGSVAASPLLTSAGPDGLVVVGSFDGHLRAYDQSGRERWNVGFRDHLYGSPAQLADGTIVQPGADGTIYALRPEDGAIRWAFDTGEPIRSSPAVDGRDLIYVGSGDGRLLVLNPNGTLRWALQLIDEARDDLNASPALGIDTIVLAGENGGVFGVPYDYCLRPAPDPRCQVGGGEALPEDGAFLLYTTPFGRIRAEPPAAIDENQPLTLSLFVRRGGDTQLAAIDADRLRVTLEPQAPVRIDVSGDRKFLTVVPTESYAGEHLNVRVEGTYLVDLERAGLRFSGGKPGGTFAQTFRFAVRPRAATALPLAIPRAPGEANGVWELYRLAAPLPTILPSYNQIGFDSIHYLIGLVGGDATRAIGWAIGGQPAGGQNRTVVDPASRVRFPLVIDFDGGLVTMTNEAGFTIEFNGFPLPFEAFRVAARVDGRGAARDGAALNTRAACGRIDFYGAFLQELGYCHPTTDALVVAGGAELRRLRGSATPTPEDVGTVRFETRADGLTAVLSGSRLRSSAHNFGLLLLDAAGQTPLPLSYTTDTAVEADAGGVVTAVTLALPPGRVRGAAQAYLMVDTSPVAGATVQFPDTVPFGVRVAHAARSSWAYLMQAPGRAFQNLAFRFLRWLG